MPENIINAIEVRKLYKTFGEQPALRGIDLAVKKGESAAVFGANGAGKTTLIKVLATIMRPSSGEIRIDGLDVRAHAEEARRRIGVVTHQTYLYGNLTAYENLDFYARMYDVPRRDERIREMVGMVGMTARLHDRVGTLSRGMQQRLALARCLLHRPSIIFLDEPETGLDQQAMALLWAAVGKESGRTVIYTTHSLEKGLEACSRVVILARGKIGYEGARQGMGPGELRELYYRHAAARVK